jgi:hypothetical protein
MPRPVHFEISADDRAPQIANSPPEPTATVAEVTSTKPETGEYQDLALSPTR